MPASTEWPLRTEMPLTETMVSNNLRQYGGITGYGKESESLIFHKIVNLGTKITQKRLECLTVLYLLFHDAIQSSLSVIIYCDPQFCSFWSVIRQSVKSNAKSQ
jgi:hypothetical protein